MTENNNKIVDGKNNLVFDNVRKSRKATFTFNKKSVECSSSSRMLP